MQTKLLQLLVNVNHDSGESRPEEQQHNLKGDDIHHLILSGDI